MYLGMEYTGWMHDWLVGKLVGWLFGQLVGWLVGLLVGKLAGWLVGWLVGRLVGRLVGWMHLGMEYTECIRGVGGTVVQVLVGWVGEGLLSSSRRAAVSRPD